MKNYIIEVGNRIYDGVPFIALGLIIGHLIGHFFIEEKPEEITVTADPMLEATYYHGNLTGKTMADGEPYLPEGRTCAIFGYPFGTKLRVSHGSNSTEVIVTDRHDNKTDIDLSFTAFQDLLDQWNGEGRIGVTVEVVR